MEVTDSKGNIEIGVGSETSSDFKDYMKKPILRHMVELAALGYGTQFSSELDEADRIVDSPVSKSEKNDMAVDPITEPQKKAIYAIYNSLGYSEDKIKKIIQRRYSKPDSKLLTKYEASNLIDYLNSLKSQTIEHQVD